MRSIINAKLHLSDLPRPRPKIKLGRQGAPSWESTIHKCVVCVLRPGGRAFRADWSRRRAARPFRSAATWEEGTGVLSAGTKQRLAWPQEGATSPRRSGQARPRPRHVRRPALRCVIRRCVVFLVLRPPHALARTTSVHNGFNWARAWRLGVWAEPAAISAATQCVVLRSICTYFGPGKSQPRIGKVPADACLAGPQPDGAPSQASKQGLAAPVECLGRLPTRGGRPARPAVVLVRLASALARPLQIPLRSTTHYIYVDVRGLPWLRAPTIAPSSRSGANCADGEGACLV